MKTCPFCGNMVPVETAKCKCGYRFFADPKLAAPTPTPVIQPKVSQQSKTPIWMYILLVGGILFILYLLGVFSPRTPPEPEKPTLASITAKLSGLRFAIIKQDTVIVDYDMDTQYDDKGYIVRAMMDIKDIAPGIFALPENINYLDIRIYGKITDKYGNETSQLAFEFILSRIWAQKINWENITNLQLANLIRENAALIQIHPALTNAWASYLSQ